MEHIKKFCENPNNLNYTMLSPSEFDIFYEYSKIVLKEKRGKIKLAQKIVDLCAYLSVSEIPQSV